MVMKTQQEIEKMKFDISEKIESLQVKLRECKCEFTYNTVSVEIKKLMAQYNILLKVLK